MVIRPWIFLSHAKYTLVIVHLDICYTENKLTSIRYVLIRLHLLPHVMWLIYLCHSKTELHTIRIVLFVKVV